MYVCIWLQWRENKSPTRNEVKRNHLQYERINSGNVWTTTAVVPWSKACPSIAIAELIRSTTT